MKLRCLAIALALLVAFASDSRGQSKHPSPRPSEISQPKQPQPQASQQQTTADQPGTEKTPLVVKVIPTPHTPEETKQDTADRKDKAAVEWGTIAISGITAIILVLQLFVFGLQARRLNQTVRAMKETEVRTLRAYVHPPSQSGIQWKGFRRTGVPWGSDTGWVFTPAWENYGSTPARHVLMHTSWGAWLNFEGDLPPDFLFVDIGEAAQGRTLIGPRGGRILTEHLQIESNILDAVQSRHLRLFIWGWISYRDSFEETPERETQFCFELNRVDGDPYQVPSKPDEKPTIFFNFRICGRHNCADEDCNQEVSKTALSEAG